MKKNILTLIAAAVMAGVMACGVQAAVYTFTPTPSDIGDLNHDRYYTWGMPLNLHAGETIQEAVLTISNIYDWTKESNDRLYVHLLDNTQLGVTGYTDWSGGGDNFAGQGTLVGVWTDPAGGSPTGFNLVYRFSTLGLVDELSQYVANGVFGFGIDSDCHYFNNGVKFVVTTAVPEPGSMMLLGSGLLGLLGVARRKIFA